MAQNKARYISPRALKYPELYRSDVSIYPRYTNFGFEESKERQRALKRKQHNQFIKELAIVESLQNKALNGVRVHREYSEGVISHKLPNKNRMSEIVRSGMTSKERDRLEIILKEKSI